MTIATPDSRPASLPVKTLADIRALNPCYDPAHYVPEDWTGTALDVLNVEQVPARDRLWVVCHPGWIDDRILHEFACWCAEQALDSLESKGYKIDIHSRAAIDAKRRWLAGKIDDDQLAAARAAARAAAGAAARAAQLEELKRRLTALSETAPEVAVSVIN